MPHDTKVYYKHFVWLMFKDRIDSTKTFNNQQNIFNSLLLFTSEIIMQYFNHKICHFLNRDNEFNLLKVQFVRHNKNYLLIEIEDNSSLMNINVIIYTQF
uniref:Selenoprotein Klike [Xiphosphorus maculatus] n=1 Tax=Lepeophtheirus salmonis TaxID=72036 RepID=A0A0K2V772_LEPSM